MVRGCRTSQRIAEARRLLASGFRRRNPEAQAILGDRLGPLQSGNARQTPRASTQLPGQKSQNSRRRRKRHSPAGPHHIARRPRRAAHHKNASGIRLNREKGPPSKKASPRLLRSLAESQNQFPTLGRRTRKNLRRRNGPSSRAKNNRRTSRTSAARRNRPRLGRHRRQCETTKILPSRRLEAGPRYPQQTRLRGPRRTLEHSRPTTRRRSKETPWHLSASYRTGKQRMKVVVAAVIERADRRILIGQRRREDTSPLKWEFPGGKIEEGETPEAALARELREELNVTLEKCAELARVRHTYATPPGELEIRFYAASIKETAPTPN